MEEEVVSIETIDIGKEILNTINALCNSLFQSINKNVFPQLDSLIFLDDDVTKTTHLKEIMGTDFSHGLLVIAECLLVAFIIYYAVRRFTSVYSGKDIESPAQFFIKAVVIGIITAYSFNICSSVLSTTHEVTESICGIGKTKLNQTISFSSLIEKLSSELENWKSL